MRFFVGCLVAIASVSAQDTVRIGTALAPATAKRIESFLATVAPEIVVEVEAVSEALIATRVADWDVHVIFGVDVQELERLASRGRLIGYDSPRRASVVPYYFDGDQRYIVPFVRPWCIAYATRYFSELTVPKRLDDLLDPAFTNFVVVPSPAAAPSLYVGLIQRQFLEGFGEERAFGWLTNFDARVREYTDSPLDAHQALLRGDARLALIPLDLVLAADSADIAYVLPAQTVPITGLGLALVLPAAESQTARKVYDHLLDAGLAQILASDAFLLPCSRDDIDFDHVPVGLRAAARNLLPCDPSATDLKGWTRRWSDHVRGKGASAEQLDMALDLVFGVLFLVFIFFVFRYLRRSEI